MRRSGHAAPSKTRPRVTRQPPFLSGQGPLVARSHGIVSWKAIWPAAPHSSPLGSLPSGGSPAGEDNLGGQPATGRTERHVSLDRVLLR